MKMSRRLIIGLPLLLASVVATTAAMNVPMRETSTTTHVRSRNTKPAWYKARQRPITPGQKAALRTLWPQYGLTFSYHSPLDLPSAFHPRTPNTTTTITPTTLEIGCGAGEALVEYAASHPSRNFLGVDWYRSGLATCCTTLATRGLTNARLVRADAHLLLDRGLPPVPTFDEVLIFFPDPWYRAEERRMVRAEIIEGLGKRMHRGGILHVATDVVGYPDHVRELLGSDGFKEAWREVDAAERRERRPSTKYERDGIAAGRTVVDLCYVFDPPEQRS